MKLCVCVCVCVSACACLKAYLVRHVTQAATYGYGMVIYLQYFAVTLESLVTGIGFWWAVRCHCDSWWHQNSFQASYHLLYSLLSYVLTNEIIIAWLGIMFVLMFLNLNSVRPDWMCVRVRACVFGRVCFHFCTASFFMGVVLLLIFYREAYSVITTCNPLWLVCIIIVCNGLACKCSQRAAACASLSMRVRMCMRVCVLGISLVHIMKY